MSRIAISLVLLFVSFFAVSPVQAANEIVGSGTAASCTEAAFDAALNNVQTTGGGILSFNCGGPATINFTSGKVISAAAVTIDGGSQITLNGANTVRHFYVEASANLTVKNITLSNGFDNTYGGGSILSLGGLSLDGATIRASNVDAGHSGGAILAYQPVTITNSLIENNTGGSVGGVFLFGEAADATITGSTFRNNHTTNNTYGLGGALTTWDGADVTVRGSTFDGNQARLGGAIYNESASTIILIEQNSLLQNNTAQDQGGGIYNKEGGIHFSDSILGSNTAHNVGGGMFSYSGWVVIDRADIRNNHSDVEGGGLFMDGGINGYLDMEIYQSTLTGNTAANYGGGLYFLNGTAYLNQVTLSSNMTTNSGGAIYSSGANSALILTTVTISGNTALYGAGLYKTKSTIALTNVTFSNNQSAGNANNQATLVLVSVSAKVKNVIFQQTPGTGANCHIDLGSTFTSLGFNLSSDGSCPLNQAGDQNNTDAMLGPLADNGGPTLTHLPRSGSPAIDAGQCEPGLTTDQRGLPRLQGLACDIGAVERQPNDTDGFSIFLPLTVR